MKKLLIVLMVAAIVVLGWLQLRSMRLDIGVTQGKTEKIIRGDLTLPIDASGEVHPTRRIEIKAEASGEVLEILKHAGELVRHGEVIIKLDKTAENRNLERAQRDVSAARARLRAAQLRFEKAREADVPLAEQQVARLEKQVELAKYRYDKVLKMSEAATNEEEILTRRTTYDTALIDLAKAKLALADAKRGVLIAEQDVESLTAQHEAVQRSLGDAKERLEKTDIASPIDGMIGSLLRQVGEVIQGGKTTLTGGTVLATVIDISTRVVRAEVDEADIGRVLEIAPTWARPALETPVAPPDDWIAASKQMTDLPQIAVDAFRDEEFTGVISRIYPEHKKRQDATFYYVDVVVVSENRHKLFNGMRADVSFTSEKVTNALLCPNPGIHEVNGQLGVYIPKQNAEGQEEEPVFVPCRIGLSNGVFSEILDGLKEGDRIYTKLPSRPNDSRGNRNR